MSRQPDTAHGRAQHTAGILTDRLAGPGYDQITATAGTRPLRGCRMVLSRPGGDEQPARRRQAAQAGLQQRIHDWSVAHPGAPLAQAAADLDLEIGTITAYLGERLRLHQAAARPAGRRYSDQEICQTLRAFAGQGSAATFQDYQRQAGERGWPSGSAIRVRYGTWAAALRAAGLPAVSYRRRATWSDQQLLDWVRRYLETAPPPWGPRGMASWLQQQPDAPSGSRIRQRWGRWQQVLDRLNHP